MDLYFVRHGRAVDVNHHASDQTRPLTNQGIERTYQVAVALRKLGVTWEVTLSSPLVRALETANIFEDVGLTQRVDLFAPLAPGGAFTDFKDWLSEQDQPRSLALVGHQPDLGFWIEELLYGQAQGRIALKRSGVARLEWSAGQAELLWLLAPKVLPVGKP